MKKDVDDKLDIYKITTSDELLKYYQRWTKENKYDQDMVDLDYVAPKEAVLLLKKYKLNNKCKILDAGCGTGLVGVELKKNAIQILKELIFPKICLIKFQREFIKKLIKLI